MLVPMWLQASVWIGAVGLVAHWARIAGGRLAAVVAIALLALSPFVLRSCAEQLADLPLGLWFAASLLCWRLAGRADRHRRRYAIASGVFLGFVLLTKNEGLLMTLAWVGTLTVAAPRSGAIRARLGAVVLAATPFALLLLAFARVAPRNDLVAWRSLDFVSWERVRIVAEAFGRVVLSPTLFKGVFLIGAVVGAAGLAAGLRALRRREEQPSVEHALLFLTLAAVTAGFFAAYLVTPHDVRWHLATSCNRLFLQLYPPLIVFVLALGADARP